MGGNMRNLGVWVIALAASAASQAATDCSGLTSFSLPTLNVVVTHAEVVPAAPPLPAHCRADGMINEHTGPDGKTYGIGFGIALPDNWNNRFLFQGGGGYNGLVRPPVGVAAVGASPVSARGFAVSSPTPATRATPCSMNARRRSASEPRFRALRDRRRSSRREAHHCRVLRRPAEYSYFTGCSTGGREAMVMTQRYPSYFDGVVSGDPAIHVGYSGLGNAWPSRGVQRSSAQGPSGRPQPHLLFSEADKKLVVDGVLNACDADDGIKDGMVFNMKARCRTRSWRARLRQRENRFVPGPAADQCAAQGLRGAAKLERSAHLPHEPKRCRSRRVPAERYSAARRSGVAGCHRRRRATFCDARKPAESVDGCRLDQSQHVLRKRRQAAVLSWNERPDFPWNGHARLLRAHGQGQRRNGEGADMEPLLAVPGMLHCAAATTRSTSSTC